MSAQGKRVRVYRLNEDGKWADQGTGHVTIVNLERPDDPGLLVIDEDDNDTLLVHRISRDNIYRRQEETIISWRDSELSTELALSFQEATGCSDTWDHICEVQSNLHFNSLGNLDVPPSPPMEVIEATRALQLNDDPEVPQAQHHHAFLKEHVVFKAAIPVKSKTHQTYRIGYIKDVILPGSLDEATTACLNSMIQANNATVIQELVSEMRSSSISS